MQLGGAVLLPAQDQARSYTEHRPRVKVGADLKSIYVITESHVALAILVRSI